MLRSTRSSPPRSRARHTPARPRMELLEDRVLLSTFTVLNTNDGGADSLRQAILDSNASVGVADTIAFNIPGAGVHTIRPLTALPTITDPVTIDGTTQPGSGGRPAIVLDGSVATPGADGLVITAGGSMIRGLIINRFQGTMPGGNGDGGLGIVLSTLGGNTIAGDYIGTDPTGTITDPDGTPGDADDLGNGGIGLFVERVAGQHDRGDDRRRPQPLRRQRLQRAGGQQPHRAFQGREHRDRRGLGHGQCRLGQLYRHRGQRDQAPGIARGDRSDPRGCAG